MNVNVIRDGRVKNALCDMMNVKWPIVMVMVIVLVANVNAFVDTKENYVKKVIEIWSLNDNNSYIKSYNKLNFAINGLLYSLIHCHAQRWPSARRKSFVIFRKFTKWKKIHPLDQLQYDAFISYVRYVGHAFTIALIYIIRIAQLIFFFFAFLNDF